LILFITKDSVDSNPNFVLFVSFVVKTNPRLNSITEISFGFATARLGDMIEHAVNKTRRIVTAKALGDLNRLV